uniref:Uncharacterized protein n=1 Tax=Cyanothece sp. (strain PCC 7425 / ATCC 29141) TaxID=395961 RepID=B8HZH7_CYAP4
MSKPLLLLSLMITLGLITLPMVAQTQTTSVSQAQSPSDSDINSRSLDRAKNLARQAAEKANGGLSKYQAEPSMHGPANQAPYVDNGNGTWTFTFTGGPPGQAPNIRTVVTVSKDGSQVQINSNTPL